MARTFILDDEGDRKAKEWVERHSKECPLLDPTTANWFGSAISYTFRPSTACTEVYVECDCGEGIIVSDDRHI